jgi:hypothetical protein
MGTTAADPGDDELARLLLLEAACRAAEETMVAIEQLPLLRFLV